MVTAMAPPPLAPSADGVDYAVVTKPMTADGVTLLRDNWLVDLWRAMT